MRRADALGVERPSYNMQGSVLPQMTLPDAPGALTQFKVPRPTVSKEIYSPPVPRDISENTYYRSRDDYLQFDLDQDGRPPRHGDHLERRDIYGRMESVPHYGEAGHVPNYFMRSPDGRREVTTVTDAFPSGTLGFRGQQQIPSAFYVDSPFDAAEQAAEERASLHRQALWNNPALGYQRITFTISRLPALVFTMLSMWVIWGRGQGTNLKNTEKGAHISAFVTGLFLLVSVILLLQQHYNSYKKALVLSYLYHIAMVFAFAGSCIVLVLAAVSYNWLQNTTDGPIKCKTMIYPQIAACYTYNQRIVFLTVQMGSAAMIILLSISTIIFGAVGQSIMKRKLTEEYLRRSNDIAATYDNHVVQRF